MAATKSYNEIRQTCKLISYEYKLAAKFGLYIETYSDGTTEYCALFSPDKLSPLPITITQHAIQDFCENSS